MLLARVLTALVFTPALMASIWAGGLVLQLTCLGLCLLILWEYGTLVFSPDTGMRPLLLALGACQAGWALQLLPQPPAGLGSAATGILALLWTLLRPEPLAASMQRVGLLLLGCLYGAELLPFLLRLRQIPGDGLGLALLALLATWGGDTGAYFAGRAFGRRRLYPAVSPSKTWEGAVGGTLTAVAVALAVQQAFALRLTPLQAMGTGAVAAILGLLGDLCESLLKRSVGAKDSSHLIPGHGGVLDRFDGVLFAVPAVYVCQLLRG